MRQDHKAGEKLFVDFAGQTVPITNPATGQIKQAQIFVATMGASNYSYGEAKPVYFNTDQTVWECKRSIGEFMEKYNARRLHQSLGKYDTPLEAYHQMQMAVAC